jgi:hypothetical protein
MQSIFRSYNKRGLNSQKILIILIVVTQLGSCREQRTARAQQVAFFSTTHLFPAGRSKSVPYGWNPLKSLISSFYLCKVRFALRARSNQTCCSHLRESEAEACLVVCILLAFLFAEIIKTWELILPAAAVDDDDAPTKHTHAGWLAAAAAGGAPHSLLNE